MNTNANNNGCISKITNSWNDIISTFKIGHPIHPLDPIAPENSEFILIDSRINIRVIHVNIERINKISLNNETRPLSSRNSLSEEYWFTKWNKPLKIGNCSCSFRRSFRFSQLTQFSIKNEDDDADSQSKSSFSIIPTRITNIDSFVERIIQDTFYEAFQECYMIGNNENTHHNLAYIKTEDEDNSEVVLRRKQLFQNNIKGLNPKKNLQVQTVNNSKCIHKKTAEKKPFVILFHGIGMSADSWWLVINSLANKGFEVIAPDMLGHGYSSTPDKANYYSFHNLLYHALTVFDHYVGNDENNKCILIGHSYGCSLVSALYRHRAQQISQMILISGGGPTPLAAPVSNSEISPFGCIHTLLKPLIFCGMKRSFLFSSRGKYFDICDSEPAIPGHILNYVKNGQNWPEGDAAYHRRILVPTLLVHGLQDKKITLVQQCEMERTIPRAFLELIPNAGHLSMIETPEHLCHMILCFIETWS